MLWQESLNRALLCLYIYLDGFVGNVVLQQIYLCHRHFRVYLLAFLHLRMCLLGYKNHLLLKAMVLCL